MALPTSPDEAKTAEKRFSKDILKFEIIGPSEWHLTVVDLPGIFHNPTQEQTQEDLVTIKRLIQKYVLDRRTIIMAILDSRNNLANQEGFKIAKQADPAGDRTIGVMTKLDALQPGDEHAALQIALNNTERLKLGWYCVRNRSTKDIADRLTMPERHKREGEFFQTAPWNQIPDKQKDVPSLARALTRLMSRFITQEFPAIEGDIARKLQGCQNDIDALGLCRLEPADHLQYLIQVARRYEREIADAQDGRYKEHGDHISKLRMHVANCTEDFMKEMRANGATLDISITKRKSYNPTGRETL